MPVPWSPQQKKEGKKKRENKNKSQSYRACTDQHAGRDYTTFTVASQSIAEQHTLAACMYAKRQLVLILFSCRKLT
jgi:hypothetical protein